MTILDSHDQKARHHLHRSKAARSQAVMITSPVEEVLIRYRATFGEPPPQMFWAGPTERLLAILDEAIRTEREVTQDLIRAQGAEPVPPGAIYGPETP